MRSKESKERGDVRKRAEGTSEPSWSEHQARLLAVRERLLELKGHVASEAAEEKPSYSQHMGDAATDQFECDLALGTLSAEQDALYEIDEALRRIEDGTYGVCELTGERIPQERLRALPWTRFTAAAAGQLERSGVVARAHIGNLSPIRGKLATEPEQTERRPAPNDEKLTRISLPSGRHLRPARRAKIKRNLGRH
jgi:RNA polymerase-binding transcription factor DksA